MPIGITVGSVTNFFCKYSCGIKNLPVNVVRGRKRTGYVRTVLCPNITGAMQAGGLSGFQNIIRMSGTGAFNDEVSKSFFEKISNGSWATSSGKVTLDASSSNDIFGRATTAQPPACQILMIIKV